MSGGKRGKDSNRKIDSGYLSLLVIVRGLNKVVDRVIKGFFSTIGLKK